MLRRRYEMHHGVRINDEALVDAAVESDRYIADRFLPDKCAHRTARMSITRAQSARNGRMGVTLHGGLLSALQMRAWYSSEIKSLV